VPGLFIAQGKVVAAEAELDWVTEWSAANDLNLGAVTEAHFEESAAEITVAAHREDKSAAADAELVQSAGIERTRVIASAEVARLFHLACSLYLTAHVPALLSGIITN
jgi:hypothetical protein